MSLSIALSCFGYVAGIGVGYGLPQLLGSGAHHAAAEDDHHQHATATTATEPTETSSSDAVNYMGVFFSIYYVMTGIHALHIIIGMGLIAWLIWRAQRGRITPQRFAAVDNIGLYWHLVDLVWIYLFPLLYLID